MVQGSEGLPGRGDRGAEGRRPVRIASRPRATSPAASRPSRRRRSATSRRSAANAATSTCWSRPRRRPRAPASTTWTPPGGRRVRHPDGGRRLRRAHLPDRPGQRDRQSDRAGHQDHRQPEDGAHHVRAHRRRRLGRAAPRDDARRGRRCADRDDRPHRQRPPHRRGGAGHREFGRRKFNSPDRDLPSREAAEPLSARARRCYEPQVKFSFLFNVPTRRPIRHLRRARPTIAPAPRAGRPHCRQGSPSSPTSPNRSRPMPSGRSPGPPTSYRPSSSPW